MPQHERVVCVGVFFLPLIVKPEPDLQICPG